MTTTRTGLLKLASRHPNANAAILELASQVASIEAVRTMTQKVQPLLATVEARNRLLNNGALGCGLGMLFAFVYTVMAEAGWAAVATLGMLFSLAVTAYFAQRNDVQVARHRTQLDGLAPIAGTDACLRALKYVETGHPSVLAWRDFAIADRGQLYAFDVTIMSYLHRQEEATLSKAQALKRTEDACRKVHGIVTATA